MAVHPVRGGGGGEAGGHFRLCLLGRAQPHLLLLARDRVGVKPLFYAFQGTTLVFGSEPKALFAYPGLTPKADTESWQEVLALSPARTPGHGVFAGVRELRGGHLLLMDENGTLGGAGGRWRAGYIRKTMRGHRRPPAHAAGGAIRRQLVSDVPLATLLSGGLDSSVITAVAARAYEAAGDPPLETYSFDYTDNEKYFKPSSFQPDADWPWVERMREAFGTRHGADLPHSGTHAGADPRYERPGSARHGGRGLLSALVLPSDPAAQHGGHLRRVRGRDLRRLSLVPPSGDAARGDLPVEHGLFRPHRGAARRGRQALELEDYARLRCRASRAETPKLDGEKRGRGLPPRIGWLNLQWFMQNLLENMFAQQ